VCGPKWGSGAAHRIGRCGSVSSLVRPLEEEDDRWGPPVSESARWKAEQAKMGRKWGRAAKRRGDGDQATESRGTARLWLTGRAKLRRPVEGRQAARAAESGDVTSTTALRNNTEREGGGERGRSFHNF
jgi:hypothetical protein